MARWAWCTEISCDHYSIKATIVANSGIVLLSEGNGMTCDQIVVSGYICICSCNSHFIDMHIQRHGISLRSDPPKY